jgi:hypothetical protein
VKDHAAAGAFRIDRLAFLAALALVWNDRVGVLILPPQGFEAEQNTLHLLQLTGQACQTLLGFFAFLTGACQQILLAANFTLQPQQGRLLSAEVLEQ